MDLTPASETPSILVGRSQHTLPAGESVGSLIATSFERRPVQEAVIAAAKANNSVLGADLVEPGLDRDGPDGDRARRAVDARIQAAKQQGVPFASTSSWI